MNCDSLDGLLSGVGQDSKPYLDNILFSLGAESLGKLDKLAVDSKIFKTPTKVKDRSRRSCSKPRNENISFHLLLTL